MDCIVFMVGIDHSSNDEERFVAIEFRTDGERYPENNPEDIKRVVDLCNNGMDKDITYVDMFGIQKAGQEVEKWEEWEDAV